MLWLKSGLFPASSGLQHLIPGLWCHLEGCGTFRLSLAKASELDLAFEGGPAARLILSAPDLHCEWLCCTLHRELWPHLPALIINVP